MKVWVLTNEYKSGAIDDKNDDDYEIVESFIEGIFATPKLAKKYLGEFTMDEEDANEIDWTFYDNKSPQRRVWAGFQPDIEDSWYEITEWKFYDKDSDVVNK